jgi:hypothetical protein
MTGYLVAHWAQFINLCKNLGYLAGALTFCGLLYRWALKPAYNSMSASIKVTKDTNSKVALLMENHLPHIQKAIDTHGETLQTIETNVQTLDTKIEAQGQRIDDTKTAVHNLGDAFVRHLDNVAKEVVVPPRKRKK